MSVVAVDDVVRQVGAAGMDSHNVMKSDAVAAAAWRGCVGGAVSGCCEWKSAAAAA
jgi:hypothetical protein